MHEMYGTCIDGKVSRIGCIGSGGSGTTQASVPPIDERPGGHTHKNTVYMHAYTVQGYFAHKKSPPIQEGGDGTTQASPPMDERLGDRAGLAGVRSCIGAIDGNDDIGAIAGGDTPCPSCARPFVTGVPRA